MSLSEMREAVKEELSDAFGKPAIRAGDLDLERRTSLLMTRLASLSGTALALHRAGIPADDPVMARVAILARDVVAGADLLALTTLIMDLFWKLEGEDPDAADS